MPCSHYGCIDYTHETPNDADGEVLEFRIHYRVTDGRAPRIHGRPEHSEPGYPAECEFREAVCTLIVTETEEYEPRQEEGRSIGRAFLQSMPDDVRERIEGLCLADAVSGCV